MKRLIIFLICLFFCIFSVGAASDDTPIELEGEYEEYAYFEDDDPGYIDIELERKVYITMDKEPEKLGDEVTLIAVLVDFHPEDRVKFQWEYAIETEGEIVWILIEDANQQTYTLVLDDINITYQYRVIVELEGIE